MKTYKIACDWMMYGIIKVKANSLQEAMEKAEEAKLPDGEYLDDSFTINYQITEEINQHIQ